MPLGGLKVPTGSLASDCMKLSIESKNDNLLQSMAAQSMRDLFTVSGDITPILKAPAPAAPDLPTAIGGNAGEIQTSLNNSILWQNLYQLVRPLEYGQYR